MLMAGELPKANLTGPMFNGTLSSAVDALTHADAFDAQAVVDAMAARAQLKHQVDNLDRFLQGANEFAQ
jgi:hypothetical protein